LMFMATASIWILFRFDFVHFNCVLLYFIFFVLVSFLDFFRLLDDISGRGRILVLRLKYIYL
jgi:hypothetical protein